MQRLTIQGLEKFGLTYLFFKLWFYTGSTHSQQSCLPPQRKNQPRLIGQLHIFTPVYLPRALPDEIAPRTQLPISWLQSPAKQPRGGGGGGKRPSLCGLRERVGGLESRGPPVARPGPDRVSRAATSQWVGAPLARAAHQSPAAYISGDARRPVTARRTYRRSRVICNAPRTPRGVGLLPRAGSIGRVRRESWSG